MLQGTISVGFERENESWRLEGTAIFRSMNGPAILAYCVQCDAQWRTVAGQIHGFVGEQAVDNVIARRGSVWTLNGALLPGMDHLCDLDLSFTPATNFHQLRRVSIAAKGIRSTCCRLARRGRRNVDRVASDL